MPKNKKNKLSLNKSYLAYISVTLLLFVVLFQQNKIMNIYKGEDANVKKSTSQLSTTSVVNQWKPYSFRIICWWKHLNQWPTSYYQSGSGTLFYSESENKPMLMTNAHVVVAAIDGTSPDNCLLHSEYMPDAYFSSESPDIRTFPGRDLALISVIDGVTGGTIQQDRNNSVISISKKSLVHSNRCSNVEIGDDVIVLGYPASGGERGTRLNVTEGIISGHEEGDYVISAKIDSGSSGGTAILKKNNCFLGVPTYVKEGNYETLGRILNVQNLYQIE